MERRYSPRIVADIDVEVHSRLGERIRARLVNMSFGGAFLAIDDMPLALNAPVMVTFPTHADPMSLWGMIVRMGQGGVGIMFLEHEKHCAHVLSQLTLATPPIETRSAFRVPRQAGLHRRF